MHSVPYLKSRYNIHKNWIVALSKKNYVIHKKNKAKIINPQCSAVSFSLIFGRTVLFKTRISFILEKITSNRFFSSFFLTLPSIWISQIVYSKLRSEQAPGSGFHPRDKSEQHYCEFVRPPWCNKKVDPER